MRYHQRNTLKGIFHGIDAARRIILNIIFWGLVLLVLFMLVSPRAPRVKDGSILVLNPNGVLVDAYTIPTSYQGIPVGGYLDETLLDDLISSLDAATHDERISGVWLRLDDMVHAGPSAAGELTDSILQFRMSGKEVVASADTFDTSRYRIASAADTVIVDRLGEVFPTGYGYWRAYYGEGLERLGAEANLFRSGESKTGAENFVLGAMSEAARRDEERLLGDLWTTWIDSVAANRGIDPEDLKSWIDSYDLRLADASGDASEAALDAGLIDAVETGGIVENILVERFGRDAERKIDAFDYIRRLPTGSRADGTVAVIPVVGALVYGRGGAGAAGSDDIVAAIETARSTPGVEAVVLRIDSPGGDVRAGEAIRRTVQETKIEWDIPVVASMGNLAASGGYWIALESDLIVARPETITGSIGVYSLSLTFEEALSRWLGIQVDGYGTTPWSGSGHPGRPLDARMASIYALNIKDIDSMFQSLVAERRGLDADAVAKLAGGIPWSGRQALDSGLADRIGGLKEAGSYAAEMAGLSEWELRYFDTPIDPREALLSRLLWGQIRIRRAGGSGFLSRVNIR